MKLNIHAFHFDLTDEVRDYAAEKIGKLEKYYKNIVMADVNLQSSPGDTANVRYICKVQLFVPKEDIFVETKAADIKESIDFAVEDLKRKIEKKKTKENPRRFIRAKDAVFKFFGREE